MKHFEEGLPNQFILFSQTPKAQEHGRALFLRFSIFLMFLYWASLSMAHSPSVSSCQECSSC